MEQNTKHVEGQLNGQETAATHSGLQVPGGRWRRLKAVRRSVSCRVNMRFIPNLIRSWQRQLLEDGPRVFATNGERKQKEQEAQEAELYEQIGRLKMELEWLKKSYPLRSVRDGIWSM